MKVELDVKTGNITLEVESLESLRGFLSGSNKNETTTSPFFMSEPFRKSKPGRKNGKLYSRHRKPYTKAEMLVIKEAVAFNKDHRAVARVLGRKPASVYYKMWKLKNRI